MWRHVVEPVDSSKIDWLDPLLFCWVPCINLPSFCSQVIKTVLFRFSWELSFFLGCFLFCFCRCSICTKVGLTGPQVMWRNIILSFTVFRWSSFLLTEATAVLFALARRPTLPSQLKSYSDFSFTSSFFSLQSFFFFFFLNFLHIKNRFLLSTFVSGPVMCSTI